MPESFRLIPQLFVTLRIIASRKIKTFLMESINALDLISNPRAQKFLFNVY